MLIMHLFLLFNAKLISMIVKKVQYYIKKIEIRIGLAQEQSEQKSCKT
ncbi:hypothetical protein FHS70_000226 [Flammeovirga yaeyamensis]|nr:hypothetical protein [Flammeovirga yaeyamensis]